MVTEQQLFWYAVRKMNLHNKPIEICASKVGYRYYQYSTWLDYGFTCVSLGHKQDAY